jgi:GTPase Era involved in 16S rRNA processing
VLDSGQQLIDLLSGQKIKRVGHALQSFTSEVQAIRIRGSIENSDRLVLVDTPGFDDTNLSDYEILTLIGEWLSTTYIPFFES